MEMEHDENLDLRFGSSVPRNREKGLWSHGLVRSFRSTAGIGSMTLTCMLERKGRSLQTICPCKPKEC